MYILRKFLIGNAVFQAALALPWDNHDKLCKITKVKEDWALWTQTRTDYCTKTAIPLTKTVTLDVTNVAYQTDFAPVTVTATSTVTASTTVFTSTETDIITSTAASTTTTTTTTTISPSSPAITSPLKRDNRGYYPPPPPPCETIYKTEIRTIWVPTVAHKTVTKTKTITPAAVTKTIIQTGTNTTVATATATLPFCLVVDYSDDFVNGWAVSGAGSGSDMPFRADFDTGHPTLWPVMFDLDALKNTGQLATEDGFILALQQPFVDNVRVFEVDPADLAASPSDYAVLTCSATGGTYVSGTPVTCTATAEGENYQYWGNAIFEFADLSLGTSAYTSSGYNIGMHYGSECTRFNPPST
ncbi:hypothetical protein ACSS6W_007553 [Trichoderma asperelloides]